ncbi:hypothetical protein ABPG72_006732 [Tetrahymena utriculariae]
MIRDFVLQQTTEPEKKFNSTVLIGNWYEERCDPNRGQSKFYNERKFADNNYQKYTLSENKFQETSNSWLNFQENKAEVKNDQFITMNMQEYKKPSEQKRNSELKPFIVKKSHFDKHPNELEEYREKWTKSAHIFDRMYLGTQKPN